MGGVTGEVGGGDEGAVDTQGADEEEDGAVSGDSEGSDGSDGPGGATFPSEQTGTCSAGEPAAMLLDRNTTGSLDPSH